MSNKNQTAVEFLLDKITLKKIDEGIYTYPTITVEEMEQFKEIEKGQMLNVFQESRLVNPMIGLKHETFLDYYNETFKKK